ncbi:MAG TPA: hypothetical protein VKA79_06320 [Aestuariivirgaceae bacterium]|jgi:hypothetical protein|nr:hypothetical protein [Aestuariivirgaceae bacterium]
MNDRTLHTVVLAGLILSATPLLAAPLSFALWERSFDHQWNDDLTQRERSKKQPQMAPFRLSEIYYCSFP